MTITLQKGPAPIGAEGTIAGKPAKRIRADVQGLRAIAVLAVIADHLFGWPTGGFVGVDVFFVLSGFLITGILMREFAKSGRISFRDFYARRIRRILPAAMLVLVVTVACAAWLLPRGRALETMVDSVWAALFAANWRMSAVGTDYFQAGLAPSPLQHYWSLSVEEQFYFVWPVLMLAVLLLAGKFSGARRAPRIAVTLVLVVLTVGSLAWGLVETAQNPTVAYFSSFTRVWELGIGAILALCLPIVTRAPASVRASFAWLGLAGIGVSVFMLSSSTPFPVPGALLPVLSTALVLAAGAGNPGSRYDRVLWPITNRAMGYIGDISYSLYLWHLPVIVLLLAVFQAGSKSYIVACLVLTAALSVASYHLVENPIRKSSWLRPATPGAPRRGSRKSRLVAWSAAATAAVILAGAAIAIVPTPRPTQVPSQSGQSPLVHEKCFGAAVMESTGAACGIAEKGATVWPAIDDLENDTGGAFKCWRPKGGELNSCAYGDESDGALRVALVGDSHAAMLVPALLPQLDELGWSLDTYLGYGCQWREPEAGSDCEDVMLQTQAMLSDTSNPYDVIITTAARWANDKDLAPAVDRAATYWDQLARQGTKVVAIADNPAVSEEALTCVARVGFDPSTSECATPLNEATAVPDPLVATSRLVEGASLVELDDLFCTADRCPTVIGNVIVYRDTAGHITGTWSRTMGPALTSRVLATLDE